MEDWILTQQGAFIYIALFLALMGGVIGLPIPEDIPLIAAGIAVQRKLALLTPVFIICYLTIILGDILIFLIGRKFGKTCCAGKETCFY